MNWQPYMKQCNVKDAQTGEQIEVALDEFIHVMKANQKG